MINGSLGLQYATRTKMKGGNSDYFTLGTEVWFWDLL